MNLKKKQKNNVERKAKAYKSLTSRNTFICYSFY